MRPSEIIEILRSRKDRGAWGRAVTAYAINILKDIDGETELCNPKQASEALLNGAPDWCEYSWGGCSLIYDVQIAERVCSPSELRRCRRGERRPNASEEWLDVQARALYQAAHRVTAIVANLSKRV